MRGKNVGQALEPKRADLGQHRAFSRDGLSHHHIECAYPFTRHDQEVVRIHLVDLANLAAAENGERKTERETQRNRREGEGAAS